MAQAFDYIIVGAGSGGGTLADLLTRDGKHTVFGKVTKGQDVVNAIAQGDKITKATVQGDTKALFEKEKAKIDEWNQVLDKRYPKK